MRGWLQAAIAAAVVAIAAAVWWVAAPARRAIEHGDTLIVRVDEAARPVLVCKGNGACLPAQMLAMAGSVAKASGSVAKEMPTIAGSVRRAGENSAAASEEAARAAREAAELVRDLRRLVNQDLHGAIAELRASVGQVAASGDAPLRSAARALDELTRLEQQLGVEIAAGSGKAQATLDAMLAVVSDPAIVGTLANVERGTGSAAEIAATVDLATRGLRQKVALVKAILLRVAGLVKVTVSPW